MKRLKQQEIKPYREKLLQEQGGLCGLCGLPLLIQDAVLDHSHNTGKCRKVIHRNDNILLGKIENSIPRNKISPEQLFGVMTNLVNYINSETEVYHPTYKTEDEKKELRKKRAKRARQRKIKK